ncbi:hypothetical protein [Streptomyces blastmyceticus]|uniref:Uncharacterized protein n=1 Tax=Streptomyces blastmyceticus TaxID=68180 RepID=A0ABN0WAW1_9ACTN
MRNHLLRTATAVALAALAVGGQAVTTSAFAANGKAGAAPAVDCRAGVNCTKVGSGYGKATSVARVGNTAYVSDGNDGYVHGVDLAGGRTTSRTRAAGNAEGVAVDGDTLYVAGGLSHTLVSVTVGSRETPRTIATDLDYPRGVALDGAGNAYVTDKDHLYKVNLKTGEKTSVAIVWGAYGVALDGKGKAYVTGAYGDERLTEVDLGKGTTRDVAVRLPGARHVALDGAGHAYVVGSYGKLTKVTLSNGDKEVISTGLSDPRGLSLDLSAGDIYLTDADTGALYRVSGVLEPTGPLKANVVQRKAVEGRPGQEWLYPSVVVENTGNRRIGTERVLVEAPPEMLFMDNELTFTRYDDESKEIHVQCTPSSTKRTLTCPTVNLDLDPGRKWAVLYPAMSIRSEARPGDAYVNFKIGNPVFAEGTSKVNIKR